MEPQQVVLGEGEARDAEASIVGDDGLEEDDGALAEAIRIPAGGRTCVPGAAGTGTPVLDPESTTEPDADVFFVDQYSSDAGYRSDPGRRRSADAERCSHQVEHRDTSLWRGFVHPHLVRPDPHRRNRLVAGRCSQPAYRQPAQPRTSGAVRNRLDISHVASLSLLPIGEVLTLVFVTPVLVTALAPLLLGEHVGWHRWFAVLSGFAGVVIMLQPDAGSFRYAALLPLAAALVASLRDIVTRRISSRESSLAILAFSIFGLILASLATAPFGWRQVSLDEIAIAGGSGLLFGIAHYLMIEGYRFAEASLVAPFRYTNLLWAPLVGYLFFGEIPGFALLAGAPLIAASGLYIVWRVRSLARRSG